MTFYSVTKNNFKNRIGKLFEECTFSLILVSCFIMQVYTVEFISIESYKVMDFNLP